MTEQQILDIAMKASGCDSGHTRMMGPGCIHVILARSSGESVNNVQIEYAQRAVEAVVPMGIVAEVFGVVRIKVRKYPGECPCGIASVDCEYHGEM